MYFERGGRQPLNEAGCPEDMSERRYDSEGLENLMTAICVAAADDFRMGLKNERKYRKRAEAIMAKKNLGIELNGSDYSFLRRYEKRQRLGMDAVAFFRSEWGMALTGCDGDNLMRRIAETM